VQKRAVGGLVTGSSRRKALTSVDHEVSVATRPRHAENVVGNFMIDYGKRLLGVAIDE
jgi:hypothetical protein